MLWNLNGSRLLPAQFPLSSKPVNKYSALKYSVAKDTVSATLSFVSFVTSKGSEVAMKNNMQKNAERSTAAIAKIEEITALEKRISTTRSCIFLSRNEAYEAIRVRKPEYKETITSILR